MRLKAKRERMKGWRTVWDACMRAARGGNEGEDEGGGRTAACGEESDAAKDGCDNDKEKGAAKDGCDNDNV